MSRPRIVRSADDRLDPRAFCSAAYPWRLIGELMDGEEITACYLVHEVRRSETKQNKPFLKLTLGDRTGTIDGMVWDDAERWEPLCVADAVVGVRGRVGVYQERMQLRVAHVEPLRAEAEDMEMLLPASPRPRPEMERELDALIGSVQDAALKKLLRRLLGRGSATGREFRLHPAAKRNHHAYLCGLLEHSLSVATACDALAGHYRAQGLRVDRDLLVAGALLHDVGKIRELKPLPSSGYTNEGQLLGHIVIGIQMVGEAARSVPELSGDRLLLLQHLIASHQGKPEWDSPKVPQLVEGLILHYADDLDAKLNPVRTLLSGVREGEWSAYDRNLARSFFLPPELPASAELEPVSSEEAVELFIDLFRG